MTSPNRRTRHGKRAMLAVVVGEEDEVDHEVEEGAVEVASGVGAEEEAVFDCSCVGGTPRKPKLRSGYENREEMMSTRATFLSDLEFSLRVRDRRYQALLYTLPPVGPFVDFSSCSSWIE
jgi:hypothetical protein